MTNDTQIEQQNALTITEQEDSDQLDPQRVRQLVAQLDIKSSQSILSFGSDAQRQINSVANNMLKDVRNKDLGGAGALLNNMVSALRGFQGKEKQLYEKPRFWNKLLGKASGVQSFIQQFEFDIEAVEQANRLLIATIEEGIQIHEQARIQRKQTEDRLIAAEQELKNALKSTISTAS